MKTLSSAIVLGIGFWMLSGSPDVLRSVAWGKA
jgi:hypothetical protein